MKMSGETTGRSTVNPNASEWESLYDQARRNIDDNLRDDNEFINQKLAKNPDYSEADAKRDLAERRAIHDEAVTHIDQVEQRMQNRTDSEYYSNFGGETNIDSGTGKARTRSVFDLYRRAEGENGVEHSERIRSNTDMATLAEYIPMLADEDTKSYSDRIKQLHEEFPRREGESADAYRDRIKVANQENRLLLTMANKMIDPDSAIAATLQEDLNNIEDMKKSGRFDEDKAKELQREVIEKAVNEQWKAAQDQEKTARRAKLKERLDARREAGDDNEAGDKEEKTDNTSERTEDDIESDRRKREETEKRIKEIEEKIAKLKEADSETVKSLTENLNKAKQKLEENKLSLAESYAKNRRLLVGAKNRAEFAECKERYAEALNEYLKIQAQLAYHQGQIRNGEAIERSKDDIQKRLDAGEITIEEANEALGGNWDKLSKELQTKLSTSFVDSYLKEQKALEASTIDRIDNGNLYRKLVSKIIDNKALKTTLAIAGVAGLAVTGFGLATGALAVGASYTAGGVALGAGKGALSGLLMSRQSSKNSAANNFVDEASIRKGLEGIDAVNNDKDVANVTKWLMQQYESANETDRSSNRKRTAIATGLGAIIGGAMSGVQVNQRISKETEYRRVVDRTPAEYRATNLESVNHAKGYGTQQFYRELGGDGDSYFSSGAHDAMAEVIKKYGMTVGENDWTYPGPVSEWPTAAREAFTEVANEWAKQGLVPASKIGGRPIYDTFTRTTTKLISSKLHNFFTQTAAVAEAGALGGTISRMQNRAPANSAMPTLNPAAAPEPIPTRPFAGTPEQPNQTAGENQTANAEQPTNEQQSANEPQPTSEQQPTNTPEQQPIDDATRIGINNLRSAYIGIGEQGVRFMSDAEGYTDEKGDQMAIWWNGLSDDAKNAIVNYETNNSNSTSGGALRQWLALQGYNLNANR